MPLLNAFITKTGGQRTQQAESELGYWEILMKGFIICSNLIMKNIYLYLNNSVVLRV